MKRFVLSAAFAACLPVVATAQAVVTVDRDTFIEQTLITVFYHELGHGLLDLLSLPMYGPNEPSADIASVMIVDRLYDEDRGIEMMTNAANLFAAEGMDRGEDQMAEFWDTHGSDQGRFYNTICVYYGGNTEGRQEMADTLGLPASRGERCEGEYQDAANSWGVLLDEMATKAGRETFVLTATDENAPLTNEVMANEIAELNADLGLDVTVPISIEPCGEPNAYYSSETKSITMCTEFEEYLGQMYDLITQ
jgi:hypothetical protein